jgi:hypothetical protein
MNSDGYVYVLTNPSIPGLVKIGHTRRNPNKRAEELSKGTGVPTPFCVAYRRKVYDCYAVERKVHAQLRKKQVDANREFFKLSVEEARAVIKDVISKLPSAPRRRRDRSPAKKKRFKQPTDVQQVHSLQENEVVCTYCLKPFATEYAEVLRSGCGIPAICPECQGKDTVQIDPGRYQEQLAWKKYMLEEERFSAKVQAETKRKLKVAKRLEIGLAVWVAFLLVIFIVLVVNRD